MSTEPSQAFVTAEAGGAREGSPPTPGDATDGARAQAAQAAGQAQEKTQQATGKAQDMLREQIDQRSGQAAEQINAQASDLRSVADALRQEGKDGPADAAQRLAAYAEKVGAYLQEKDSHALLADAEDFGRQRPWAAAAGGLAIGLAASRFLKASSARRYQTRATASRLDQIEANGGSAGGLEPPRELSSSGVPGTAVPAAAGAEPSAHRTA